MTLDPLGKSGRTEKHLTIATATQSEVSVRVTADVQHWVAGSSTETFEDALFGRPECVHCHATPAVGRTGVGLYIAVCGMCHGTFAKYAPSIDPVDATAEALRTWIAEGRADGGMPGYSATVGGPLTDDQIDSLVRAILDARRAEGEGGG